ncbi:iron (metal) dependent repressor, DtxR family [Cnuella takakiae]|uniref:Transcriptional regulator MntR n=1 Tax=Cnuella takakiae TaxID=1302690 RepID=A0A1M5FYN1_9BACT|nr:metal-dependent transcriptional regulator [Cnuella takakiae]OLY92251.1 hypothetical protein BUE76_10365 [Cnuella takakiae]SHF96301.1 iron (metal) dependent repressor, DtxR family [Cnuella takakiae]
MAHFAYYSEENYLKALYKLEQKGTRKLTNAALSKMLDLNPATVLEMVRKLEARELVSLLPDRSIQLTNTGRQKALVIIRKHRLWEVFLVDKLHYNWNEVHELAEQLEHIESADLVDRLETFLGFPAFDPHGDPIPDKEGHLKVLQSIPVTDCTPGKNYLVQHFAETSDAFLDYLQQVQVKPGIRLQVNGINAFDRSFNVSVGKRNMVISEKVAANILVLPEGANQ